jgi:hypothetical protein
MNSDYWFQQVHSSTAKKTASKFFNEKRCVLNLTHDKQQCDWHHLDEDDENNPRIGNLVPLSRNLNQAIETARNSRSHHLTEDLNTGRIRDAAFVSWKAGRFAHSYGANRLGSFLEKNYRNNPSQSLLFATEALHGLRPLSAQEYAIDTINRNILPLVSDPHYSLRLTNDSLAALCKEIASWFLDSEDYREFNKWKKLGRRFAAVSLTTDSDTSAIIRARLLQHHGFTLYQVGNLTAAKRAIISADKIMRELYYYNGMSNNHQYLMRIALQEAQQSRSQKCLGDAVTRMYMLEREFGKIHAVDEWNPKQGADLEFWTGVGLIQIKAEITHKQKKNKQAEDLFETLAILFRSHKIKTMGAHPITKGIYEFISKNERLGLYLTPYLRVPALHKNFCAATKNMERVIHNKAFSEKYVELIKLARKHNRAVSKRNDIY